MNEFLPVRFEFSFAHVRWEPLQVKPEYWHCGYTGISLCATVLGREPKEVFIQLDQLPPLARPEFSGERLDRLTRTYEAALRQEERGEITIFECLPAGTQSKPRHCDPRGLRDEFLGLKEDTLALMKFLNRYGAWGYGFRFGRWQSDWLSGMRPEGSRVATGRSSTYTVPPHYFWQYRALLRKRLEQAVQEPATWFSSTMDLPPLQLIPDYPFHMCHIAYAQEAIEVSFAFDFAKNEQLSLCGREDCRRLFRVTRTGRKFCSEKCARCMVTRRKRLRNRVKQSEA
jgi:hypothetical protein